MGEAIPAVIAQRQEDGEIGDGSAEEGPENGAQFARDEGRKKVGQFAVELIVLGMACPKLFVGSCLEF
jgi:hypothetical protein